jgi:hypothetical protein
MRPTRVALLALLVACGGAPDKEVKTVQPEPQPESKSAATPEPPVVDEGPAIPDPKTEWYQAADACPEGSTMKGRSSEVLRCMRGEVRHGRTIQWGHGQIQVVTYAEGILEGPYAIWKLSGERIEAGEYKAGKQEGTFTTWHPSGAKAAEGRFSGDNREGIWTFYGEDGEVLRTESYENGELVEGTGASE